MYYTQEQIDRANQADLVSFLQSQGEQLTRAGNEYRWKRHDSLTVRGNKWYRHSQSKGGAPVDFVMEFFGKSFTEAVELLTGEKGAAPPPDRQGFQTVLGLGVFKTPARYPARKPAAQPVTEKPHPDAPQHHQHRQHRPARRALDEQHQKQQAAQNGQRASQYLKRPSRFSFHQIFCLLICRRVGRPLSDLHQDGEDHRAALGAAVDIAAQRLAHTGLNAVPVADVFVHAAVQRVFYDALGTVHQALVLAHVDEAAAHEIGAGQHLASLAVHGGHDDDEAVLRQVLAVPQDHIPHVAHAEAVHHDGTGRDRFAQLDLIPGQDDVGAVFCDEDVAGGDAEACGGEGMLFQLLVLAVHRQEILGPGQGEHQLLLLLAGVAGDVDIIHALVDDLCAQQQQTVDDLGHALFVAGDGEQEDAGTRLGRE